MYEHQRLDEFIGQALDIATPADPIAAAFFRPGYQPITPRAIFAIITTQATIAATILTFKFRPTIGSAAGEVVIGTLTIPINAPVGNVYYKKVSSAVKCLPGGEIVCQTDGGATAGNASIGVSAEPTWDAPENNAKMVASA